ncbi:MAG: hypothetical protein ACYDC2_06220 [Solirubrobacteraceae bacterium]
MSRRTGPASKPASAPGSYPSVAAFYDADPVRSSSREQDVGLWWRQEPADPLHRAAWVCDTGELYLVRLGPPEEGGGRVEVLTTVATPDQLEKLLEGWRDHCGEPRSLSWLRGRVRRWTASRRSRPVRRLRTA